MTVIRLFSPASLFVRSNVKEPIGRRGVTAVAGYAVRESGFFFVSQSDFLFMPQSDNRIDVHRAPARDVAGEQGDEQQHCRDGSEGRQVRRGDSVE